eukprot:m.32637 g.32637  ORF g.32637 m.32637 type:complete len:334 (-) comp5558_c0_seq2:3218-4219(-)
MYRPSNLASLLLLVVAAALLAVVPLAAAAIDFGGLHGGAFARPPRHSAPHRSHVPRAYTPPILAAGGSALPVFNVRDYGAKGDGSTDDTGAFAAALSAAATASGGEVFVPTGRYLLAGTLAIPSAVVLRGSYLSVPSHPMVDKTPSPPSDGSVLMPTAGRGNDSATPFITINADAAMAGFVVYYPEQTHNTYPVPYPYSVSMIGNNAALTDVELLNSWNGISAVAAHRHYIARIQGQPINIGVFVDETYDVRLGCLHRRPCLPMVRHCPCTAHWYKTTDWPYRRRALQPVVQQYSRVHEAPDHLWALVCLWPLRLGVRVQHLFLWVCHWLPLH